MARPSGNAARLLSSDTSYYVNVHADASGSGEPHTVACGDITNNEQITYDHEEEHHDH